MTLSACSRNTLCVCFPTLIKLPSPVALSRCHSFCLCLAPLLPQQSSSIPTTLFLPSITALPPSRSHPHRQILSGLIQCNFLPPFSPWRPSPLPSSLHPTALNLVRCRRALMILLLLIQQQQLLFHPLLLPLLHPLLPLLLHSLLPLLPRPLLPLLLRPLPLLLLHPLLLLLLQLQLLPLVVVAVVGLVASSLGHKQAKVSPQRSYLSDDI